MTTEMYKSAKRLRLLVNDPNHIIASKANIRTNDDVLNRISAKNKISRTSIGTSGGSSDKTSANGVAVKSFNAFKRQKTTVDPKTNVLTQENSSGADSTQVSDFRVFRVIYGVYKPNKKHKQFSSDGFITVGTNNLSVKLYSIEGKNISNPKAFKSWDQFESGCRFVIGCRELEIDEELSAIEFKNKTYFVENTDFNDN